MRPRLLCDVDDVNNELLFERGGEDMRVVIVVSGYRIGSDPDWGRSSSFDGLHLLLQ